MKKTWLVVVGVVAVLAVGCLAGCSPTVGSLTGASSMGLNMYGQQEGIWISGEGKVTVTPDTAILTVGIQSQEPTVAEAQSLAAEAMDKVMAALKDQGIAEKDIKTQNYSIRRVTRWDNDTQQEVLIGYQVSNLVTVKVRTVDTTGAVIDAVAAAGGDLTRIDGINFTVDDPSSYYEEARKMAVQDALNKAKQLAQAAGVKLGSPVYITESSYSPAPVYRADSTLQAGSAAEMVPTPISPGEQDITVTVQIAYAIG